MLQEDQVTILSVNTLPGKKYRQEEIPLSLGLCVNWNQGLASDKMSTVNGFAGWYFVYRSKVEDANVCLFVVFVELISKVLFWTVFC